MTTATFRDIVDDLSICIQTDGNDSGRNALLPTCLPVPRIPQQENWDCGIACLQMVLHFVNGGDGADAVHSREAIMRRVGPSVKSVWTIDLAIALASFLGEIRCSSAGGSSESVGDVAKGGNGEPACKRGNGEGSSGSINTPPQKRRKTRRCSDLVFCTQVFGVEPQYAEFDFYKHEFDRDSARVNGLFAAAPSRGVRLLKARVPVSVLRRLICSRRVVIILLADLHLLSRSRPFTISNRSGAQLLTSSAAAAVNRTQVAPVAGVASVARRRDDICGTGSASARDQDTVAATAGLSASLAATAAANLVSNTGKCLAAGLDAIASAVLPTTAPQRPYTGHFIVLCGYLPHSDEFVYNDPGKSTAARAISAEQLDVARFVEGTDEDMLVVSVPEDAPCASTS